MATKNHKISVVGLGKLGAPLATVLAQSGNTVVGVDLNTSTVEKVNNGQAPINETGLQDCLDTCSSRLSATVNCHEAVANTDVTFLIVPTPSASNHQFDNSYLISALKDIGKAVRNKSTYHLVVIVSTVMPGSMNGELRQALETSAMKTVHSGELGLCYNPEFIALGDVINNMTKPDFLLIGESDSYAGDLLTKIRMMSCESGTPVRRMNFINAELAKIAVNTFVTTKISYANMLAELCENTEGANVDEVTSALGNDSRIGAKYLKGGIGYGGPCLPRDNKAFAAFGATVGVDCSLANATDIINERQLDRLATHIQKHCDATKKVCVLGLAYKANTAETDESQGIALCRRLAEIGYSVSAHDPMSQEMERFKFEGSIKVYSHYTDALSNSSLVIIMTPLQQYSDILEAMNVYCEDGAKLIDPWRMIDKKYHRLHTVIPLGKKD